MSAPYDGKSATFYISRGTSTSRAAQAMTQVGATKEFYITDRTRAWWDPDQPVEVYDNGVEVTDCRIDHAGGYIVLPPDHSIVGAITVDCYTIPMERMGGGYGHSTSVRSDPKETTIWGVLGTPASWKTFIGSGILTWTGNLRRHWYYARAMVTTAIVGDNNDLTWTWKGSGSPGNNEAIKYQSGGSLEITRADNETTVTYVIATTTAAQIKAHLEADPVLSLLWDVSYPVGNTGAGVVGDVAHVHATGGRDSLEQIASLSSKFLCVFYLDGEAATGSRLEGVGIVNGLDLSAPLEDPIEADLTFQGTGRLNYHAI